MKKTNSAIYTMGSFMLTALSLSSHFRDDDTSALIFIIFAVIALCFSVLWMLSDD